MYFNLFKDSLEFPYPTRIFINDRSMQRVINMLKPFVGKKSNIRINLNVRNRIFISNFISFCKLENIDYKDILEIEVIPLKEVCQIIVRTGSPQDVKLLSI